jgi:DUF4097 and DUF4098 domain-containing protein YvlB
MRKAPLTLTTILTLLAAVAFSLPAFAADEVFDRTIPLPAGGTFELANVNGSVTLTGWDREAVEVHAVKSTQQSPDELARVQIETDAAPGRVSVTTVYPHDVGLEVAVEYDIRVPRRVLLAQVATVNGTVRVSGVEGAGELRSVNGSIALADSAGVFSARTTNGDIRMELTRLAGSGTAALETVNGSIALALPKDTSATLDARSLNGDFRSELPISLLDDYRPRELRGRLGAGGVPVQLRTVNGAIRVLALPQGI